jgi:hypothetical protein
MQRAFLRFLYAKGEHYLLWEWRECDNARESVARMRKILGFTLHERHPTLRCIPEDVYMDQCPLLVQVIPREDHMQIVFGAQELWLRINCMLYSARLPGHVMPVYEQLHYWNLFRQFDTKHIVMSRFIYLFNVRFCRFVAEIFRYLIAHGIMRELPGTVDLPVLDIVVAQMEVYAQTDVSSITMALQAFMAAEGGLFCEFYGLMAGFQI